MQTLLPKRRAQRLWNLATAESASCPRLFSVWSGPSSSGSTEILFLGSGRLFDCQLRMLSFVRPHCQPKFQLTDRPQCSGFYLFKERTDHVSVQAMSVFQEWARNIRKSECTSESDQTNRRHDAGYEGLQVLYSSVTTPVYRELLSPALNYAQAGMIWPKNFKGHSLKFLGLTFESHWKASEN